jgi:hypothetical protein
VASSLKTVCNAVNQAPLALRTFLTCYVTSVDLAFRKKFDKKIISMLAKDANVTGNLEIIFLIGERFSKNVVLRPIGK